MQALRWHGRGDVRLDEVPDAPPPKADEVRIAVAWCGICGTDLEEYRDGPLVITTEPHPLTGDHAPTIIGHEIAGVVADVGHEVTDLREGQLVAVDGLFFCGTCSACRRHQPNLCPQWAFIGMGYPGGLAEAVTVPTYMAIPAPAHVGADHLALAEPMSVAVRAVRRSGAAAGSRVAILGLGTIGLGIQQVLRSIGVDDITAVDPVEFRRGKASALGASATLAPDDGLAEALRSGAGGGPDVIFDCTGSPRTPGVALDAVRSGGRIVLVGLPPEPAPIDYLQLALREIELVGSISHVYDEDFAGAVELIASGAIDADALITHRLPLARAVTDGIEFLAGPGAASALKILVSPTLG
jgi:(R,R)-butanediol dehydrogenase/meso-butanediol dehydrogenase/diacetyl reductase